jgi:hypothetical protein
MSSRIRIFFDAGAFFWKNEQLIFPDSYRSNEYRLVTLEIAKAV